MPTLFLFRDDAYLVECEATVTEVTEKDGNVAVGLDRTVFYPTGGGQPGDAGMIRVGDVDIPVATAVYGATKSDILHVLAPGATPPAVGSTVLARIDWPTRHKRMRMHTGLHLLSVALPYPVTGGSIGTDESRLDFDIPEAGLDKDAITAKLNALIATDAAVTERWITDAELEANPGLVKTMSVKPPMGSGRVRLVDIAGLDLQPCGGTHVRRTGEIGPMAVSAIEKKGKQNRRVRVVFA
ncbi:alanyl-tRNA editing protein [Phreatobacter oligotrophus]|jgi:misacylated tRNA(Ala) deacylase|uniref:Alanine--tRNA ligase n=1 Tax=Phreatobacter oligotrophus TaxID=1122261 RepID=A0A2T4Z5L7_9HYPH|nr:alanyl-tRNA editing protein [Phreatobacter oligotrophus]PTM57187.1 misacylated tRNA(Ala) deacylase [Phreatobacter oligotrophus]